MLSTKTTTAFHLSVIIVLLALLASAGGLLANHLYRDNLFVKAAWRANDLVTLFLAVPLLVLALFYGWRGSPRAQLVWLALLDYMLYNYAFYLFGAHFNAFFLLYVALFTGSIFALLFGLLGVNATAVQERFRTRTPVKGISIYMIIVAVGLSSVYMAQSVHFIVTGKLPGIVTLTGHPTSIVFALDLSLLVPGLLLGAIWLWKKNPWGYVLAGMFVIKGTLYTLVLTLGSFFASRAGLPEAAAEMPLWMGLTVAGLLATAFLLGNMKAAAVN